MMSPYHLTRQRLLSDLYEAYLSARRHKRNRGYQQRFEQEMELNLEHLCQELWTRTYRPSPSECFIICDPKQREVFAADFRDRIVHHLYYNYVYQMFERTFIADSYSCIVGRGTLYGVHRLEQHIRQESQNYTEACYVLKMDIRGYFMGINRKKLLDITLCLLHKMSSRRISRYRSECWGERIDVDFLCRLSKEIILLDPTAGCRAKGYPQDWEGLPKSKSLFHAAEGCGLPIGNLTSQLFSNVYLNVLDQWMKRFLGCRHYGRYVDDFYVVSCDREWLRGLIPQVRRFLLDGLGLQLHEGKTMICNARYGVEYLGAYLKPWRTYIGSKTLRHMEKKIWLLEHSLPETGSPRA